MEQLIMNLALQYAKNRGLNAITDKAIDYAYETLGIENEEDYTGGGIYGMRNAFSPANLGRTALKNFATKALTGGSGSGITGALPVFGAALGLGYMTNPLREGSYNYNPNLQGQLDYAGRMGYLNRNNNAGALRYGGDSVLSGQNAISGFGTNDLLGQLNKNLNRLQGYKNPNNKTFEMIEKTKAEIAAFELDQVKKDLATETTTNNNGVNNNYGSIGKVDTGGFEQDGTGRQGYGSGGIASL